MSNTVIRVENLSKQYRLGVISGGRLRDDLSRGRAKRHAKPDIDFLKPQPMVYNPSPIDA